MIGSTYSNKTILGIWLRNWKKKLHFTWTPKNGMVEKPSFNGQELGSGGI
jgi:hypothetical protein